VIDLLLYVNCYYIVHTISTFPFSVLHRKKIKYMKISVLLWCIWVTIISIFDIVLSIILATDVNVIKTNTNVSTNNKW